MGNSSTPVFRCLFCGERIFRTKRVEMVADLTARPNGKLIYRSKTVEGQAGHDEACPYNVNVRTNVQRIGGIQLGAFDGDKTLGRGEPLVNLYGVGQPFILWELVEVMEGVEIPNSELGATTKCVLSIADVGSPEDRKEASVIGATADKLKDLDPAELPAVCKVIEFTSKTYGTEGRTVQYVEDYVPA